MSTEPAVGRLAPTPSGNLHLGNITAFAAAWLSARAAGGRVLLRVEDLDADRRRPEIADAQRADLTWLGLDWDAEVTPQSGRSYAEALRRLAADGATYRCGCTRAAVAAAGGVYPGTCRDRALEAGVVRLRLPNEIVTFEDRRFGLRSVSPVQAFGDPIIARRDGTAAYPLAVVVDDDRDGVTEVVRGADLLDHTALQIQVRQRLGVTRPMTWMHAPLILGPDGKKLSKSHQSLEIRSLRDAGWRPADVWRTVLPWLGLPGTRPDPSTFEASRGPRGPITWMGRV